VRLAAANLHDDGGTGHLAAQSRGRESPRRRPPGTRPGTSCQWLRYLAPALRARRASRRPPRAREAARRPSSLLPRRYRTARSPRGPTRIVPAPRQEGIRSIHLAPRLEVDLAHANVAVGEHPPSAARDRETHQIASVRCAASTAAAADARRVLTNIDGVTSSVHVPRTVMMSIEAKPSPLGEATTFSSNASRPGRASRVDDGPTRSHMNGRQGRPGVRGSFPQIQISLRALPRFELVERGF